MSRLKTAAFLAKQAAFGLGAAKARLSEEGGQLLERLRYPDRPLPPVPPELEDTLEETLPGTDPDTAQEPSNWPFLLAAAALLGLGGALYATGPGFRKGKAK
jgi:hypothetical protein